MSDWRWEFDDGTVVSNVAGFSRAWSDVGDHPVLLRAYNQTWPDGLTATVVIHVFLEVHYVVPNNPSASAPYTTWASAATNIQDAVDAAVYPGAVVLVSNGVYQTGGMAMSGGLLNRVAVAQQVTLRSLNGPAVTVIRGAHAPGSTNGAGAVRGVWLYDTAVLSGFTVASGATLASGNELVDRSGGGVWCLSTSVLVTNCILAGNSAAMNGGGVFQGVLQNCLVTENGALVGGGAYNSTLNHSTLRGNHAVNGGGTCFCTLNNCTLTGNSATLSGGGDYTGNVYNCLFTGNSALHDGGGASQISSLNNCTLVGNTAPLGGGAYACAIYNCILYYNTPSNHAGLSYAGPSYHCCTTPHPGDPGSITAEPLFVDLTNGNLRLQSNSPCINAGDPIYAPGPTDLDGRPRIVGGTVDMGAYEFQSPSLSQFLFSLAQAGLPTDGSADYTDPDRDGLNNWQEWVAGTDPTNAASVLRVAPLTGSGSGVVVSWLSATNHIYSVERSTNVGAHPPFQVLATGLLGQAGMTTFTDTNAPASGPVFYRVSTNLSP